MYVGVLLQPRKKKDIGKRLQRNSPRSSRMVGFLTDLDAPSRGACLMDYIQPESSPGLLAGAEGSGLKSPWEGQSQRTTPTREKAKHQPSSPISQVRSQDLNQNRAESTSGNKLEKAGGSTAQVSPRPSWPDVPLVGCPGLKKDTYLKEIVSKRESGWFSACFFFQTFCDNLKIICG